MTIKGGAGSYAAQLTDWKALSDGSGKADKVEDVGDIIVDNLYEGVKLSCKGI